MLIRLHADLLISGKVLIWDFFMSNLSVKCLPYKVVLKIKICPMIYSPSIPFSILLFGWVLPTYRDEKNNLLNYSNSNSKMNNFPYEYIHSIALIFCSELIDNNSIWIFVFESQIHILGIQFWIITFC